MAKKKKQPQGSYADGGVSPPGTYDPQPDGPTKDGNELIEVPWGSYDPTIEAQLQASRRGLSDLKEDTKTAGTWSKTDLKTSLGDIRRSRRRTVQDVRRSQSRENQKLNFRTTDLNKDAGRNRQDFASRLAGISRSYKNKAGVQQEAQNAAGTLEGGTGMAAAQKRAENMALDVAPVTTAANRMEEDLKTSLGRISVSRGQMNRDAGRSLRRDKVDTKRDVKLTKRDYGRDKFDRGRKLGRGIREQTIGESDLAAQKIDSARQRAPGVFSRYGKKKGN